MELTLKFRMCLAFQAIVLLGASLLNVLLIRDDDCNHYDCCKLKDDALLLLCASVIQYIGATVSIVNAPLCLQSRNKANIAAAIQVILGTPPLTLLVYLMTKKDVVKMCTGQWVYLLDAATVLYILSMVGILYYLLKRTPQGHHYN